MSGFPSTTINFPAEVVRNCTGLAVDIGGSAVKFLYRTKSDFEALESNPTSSFAPLHLLTCSRDDLDAGIAQVQTCIHISKEKEKVNSCGIGGYQLNTRLQQAFDIGFDNLSDGDCLVEGLKCFLHRIPEKDMVFPILVDVINVAKAEILERAKTTARFSEKSKTKFWNVAEDAELVEERPLSDIQSIADVLKDELYPCLIVQLGSNNGFFTLEKDGTPKFCETTFRGGRYMMGVASLLTGVKSYDELIDLAERGDNINVDQSVRSILSKPSQDNATEDDSADDPYKALKDANKNLVAYMFGHAVFQDKDKFQREDLATAWVMAHVSDLVATLHHHVARNNIKHVFVTGSMVNREYVRKVITEKLLKYDSTMKTAHGKTFDPTVQFIRGGGHLQAVGALMNTINK